MSPAGTVKRAVLVLWCLAALSACEPQATFSVRESVEQLHVTHAVAGQALVLFDGAGHEVARGEADALGSLIFRRVTPGSDYVVRTTDKTPARSRALTVMSVESSKPDPASYAKQVLGEGFNYLTMRDGTTLSAWVTLPRGRGPFPTVVNYSGYDPSRPQEKDPSLEFLCADFPVLCPPPADASAMLAGLFNYATVSVNIRGTGCSGGAYDFFERLQRLDGYDVIEIVAAQDWAQYHSVGMVGLSYPGISQLFVAAERPPSLAAIAPMAVIASTDTTLLPGGILNDGFALTWVKRVVNRAVPYGQGWERARADAGDTVCAENQLLHGQLIDNVAQARTTVFYDPALHDVYNPSLFVDQVNVPVFLEGVWQDEQTGPYFFKLFDRFTNSPAKRFTATNGVHADGFAPQVVGEWLTFLELFVARRVPKDPVQVRNFSPLLYEQFFGAPMTLPPSRLSRAASYEEALATWKAEPPLRVLFESGAGTITEVGTPQASFERSFAWPPAELSPQTLHLGVGGTLTEGAPTTTGPAAVFQLDPTAGKRGVLAPGGDPWAKLPPYVWTNGAPGKAVTYESAPLAEDLVLLGTASVDLWLRSPVDDADLQVTLSEVRPDAKETYIQSGWLRAGHRKPGPAATALWPAQTLMEDAWAPLPIGEWTQVRVGTAGFAHALRAGSRVRLSVDTPGGVRSEWRFANKTFDGTVSYEVGQDSAHPSQVVLPRLVGVKAQSPLPPCPSLRGQPCRAWMAPANVER